MSSNFTTNKDLEQPANGDYVNDWNVANNNNFSVVDAALGRVATINVTGISTTPNLLNSVLGSPLTNPNSQTVGIFQYQCQTILFTGTITTNLVYQIPSGISGTWNVYNASSGAFTITIQSAGSVAGGVVLTQAVRMQVTSDGGANYGVTPTTMFNFSAAGSTTQVQFNNAGTLAGSSSFTFNGTTVAAPALSLTSTPLAVGSGGSGAATLATNNVLLGNGTSALKVVAPGTPGNVLTSDGAIWSSQPIPSIPPQTFFSTITDVSGSRSIGTPYTNSTGKPLFAMVSATPSDLGAALFMSVNGILCAQTGGSNVFSVSCMVPAGAHYIVTSTSGPTINGWAEAS